MFAVILLILWIILPGAVHGALARQGRAAVPAMAGLSAIALGVASTSRFMESQGAFGSDEVYRDTYYIVVESNMLATIAVAYIVVLALAMLIEKLAGGWPRRLLPPMFWLLHLGVTVSVFLPVLARLSAPKRYIDYPDAFSGWNTISTVGKGLCFLGATGLVVLTLAALVQAENRKLGT